MCFISEPLQKPLAESLKLLSKAASTASDVLKATASDRTVELPDKKDILDAIAKSKKSIALVTNMLAAIAKSEST